MLQMSGVKHPGLDRTQTWTLLCRLTLFPADEQFRRSFGDVLVVVNTAETPALLVGRILPQI
jgi:hypothetical protein